MHPRFPVPAPWQFNPNRRPNGFVLTYVDSIGKARVKGWWKTWRGWDTTLTGYTACLPVINLLWSIGYWLTRPVDRFSAPHGYTLLVNTDAYTIATVLLAAVWFATKKGYLWGFGIHVALGAWVIFDRGTFGLFSSNVSINGGIVLWNPYFAEHPVLRDSFLAVSLYCLVRLVWRLLFHGTVATALNGTQDSLN